MNHSGFRETDFEFNLCTIQLTQAWLFIQSEGSAQFHSKGCNILLVSFLYSSLVQTKLVWRVRLHLAMQT